MCVTVPLILGNKSGNRRTANIRSIGYSDLFSLSKEDLTNVLSEFPAAKRLLEEKGRQILTKMGMLVENGEGEEDETNKVETKITRLQDNLEILWTKLARLVMELESSNRKMQARVEQLEWEVATMEVEELRDEEETGRGRGEGVGGELELQREEAEGEEEKEEEDDGNGTPRQGQAEDNGEVTKEGDGESTKSTKDSLVEGNKEEKSPAEEEGTTEKSDARPGKGDGAEIVNEEKDEGNTEEDREEPDKKGNEGKYSE